MEDRRMNIKSLLNTNDDDPDQRQQQRSRPGSTAPSTEGSDFDSRVVISSRENTQTPSAHESSLSPTISERSRSSNTVTPLSRKPRRQSSSNGGSSTSESSFLSQTHRSSHLFKPYNNGQREDQNRTSRQFRPSYDEEESFFIWYHRIDLNLDWRQVASRFNHHFEQQRTGFQGFQCKFYRFLQEQGLPSTRERAKDPDGSKTYGVRRWRPDVQYVWMNNPVTQPFAR